MFRLPRDVTGVRFLDAMRVRRTGKFISSWGPSLLSLFKTRGKVTERRKQTVLVLCQRPPCFVRFLFSPFCLHLDVSASERIMRRLTFRLLFGESRSLSYFCHELRRFSQAF